MLEATILAKDRELLMTVKGAEQSGTVVRKSDHSVKEPDPLPGFFDQPGN
ncbi:hypothetical protein [Sphingobium chlorophenolicum]|nr:hypothetical protein [Sphingobium chlorophenolicum]